MLRKINCLLCSVFILFGCENSENQKKCITQVSTPETIEEIKKTLPKKKYFEWVQNSGKSVGLKFFHDEKEIDFWSIADIENKNPFEKYRGKSLEEITKEERKFLLEGANFSDGFNISSVKFLFPITFPQLEPHRDHKWLGLSHNLFFKVDEYGVIAEKAIIEVYDNNGKLHSRIISNDNGASGPLITQNGRYLLNQYGRNDGESGYFKAGIKIYEIPEGKLIYTLETDDLNRGNDAFSTENVFVKRIITRNNFEYLIFAPEKKIVYQKTLRMAEEIEIKTFMEEGYLKKDNTIVRYEDEFEIKRMD